MIVQRANSDAIKVLLMKIERDFTVKGCTVVRKFVYITLNIIVVSLNDALECQYVAVKCT